jgi:pyridinium-3,5-biscarboxylic acid mononucleotide sulfurtransferase
VDSVLLAKVAHEELGDRMLAAIADSPSLPRRELEEAQSIAAEFGFPLEILRTEEFSNADYAGNPMNRCYFCKHELFTHLKPLARERGFAVIAYGENASDVGDWRPGAVAAEEFQVRAPLKEARLSKDAIRAASRALGLPTAAKPAMPCLSSRIPYGEEVTREKVAMIEQAENMLRDLGFTEVRVRHHQGGKGGPKARIEVGTDELERLRDETFERTEASLKAIGYNTVDVDRRGYRRGSLNTVSADEANSAE